MIASQLIDARNKINMTQKELAEKTGIYQADISKINLVEIINDNKKIVISRVTNSETKEEPKKDDNKININTCTKSDLMKLSGIGSTKAQAIINYRDKNGKFKKIEDFKVFCVVFIYN